ncbi:uncharacterized protein BDV17DRAFT_296852 [Aspergillus undulatus]|uniref:uncharacterized protein n=1 Tax=Aspergillus undulatus TaxID=1810928 RepID=UPI003CCE34B9
MAEIKARAAADAQEAASQLRITRWAWYLAKETVYYQDLLDIVAMPDPEQEDFINYTT